MASNMLTNLRGPDQGANRQTDAISRLVEPVAKAVMATPIMGAKPPAWIRPPLQNGFVDTGQPLAPARYHRDVLGYVHVQGHITSPAGVGAGAEIATLPSGFRPAFGLVFAAKAAAFDVVRLSTAGVMSIGSALAAGAAITFSFSFLAEQ
jgi:hypothetical protein